MSNDPASDLIDEISTNDRGNDCMDAISQFDTTASHLSMNISMHSAFPTPPPTPFSSQQHGSATLDRYLHPQTQEIEGSYFEENNNMDENSNDQEYDQYAHYHQQHYEALQAQNALYERNSIMTNRREEAASSSAGSRDDVPNSRQSFHGEWFPSAGNHNLSNSQYEPNSDLPGLRSVKPRTTLPHRRLSLNPESSYVEQQQCANICPPTFPNNSIRYNNSNKQTGGSGSQRFSHNTGAFQGTGLAFPQAKKISHRSHRRNSSFDSSLTELYEQEYRHAEFGRSTGNSNNRNISLPPLPVPVDSTEREAEALLYHFTQEELARERLTLPNDIGMHPDLQDCNLLRAGTELRRLADAFAATPARAKVRAMAEEVLIPSITWENFACLCEQLFAGERGITAERIVALFTFIADVAKQQFKRGVESCIRKLMVWALRFMVERVCQWVQQAGGWGRALHQGLDVVYKVAVSVAAVVAVAAMAVYITKTVRQW